MIEYFVIAILAGLNVAQLVHSHKLINKLMSRNFVEYDQIVNKPAQAERELISFDEYEDHHEEEEILRELNGMIKV